MQSAVTSDVNMTEVTTVPEGCLVFSFSNVSASDNPEDIVSRETRLKFTEILDVYVLCPLFFISVPLNIINMIVFWKHGLKERINLCLFALSFADAVIVAGFFGWHLDSVYAVITNTLYKPVILKYSINNMIHSLAGFAYVSGFMSTLVALERCVCVVSPLRAQSMLKVKTIAIIIINGHIFILGAHYIVATKFEVVCMYDPFTGHLEDRFHAGDFYQHNKQLIDTLEGTVFGFLLPGIYVTVVSLSTIVTVIKLRQMKEWRKQSASVCSASTVKDVTLTRMLIGTNILFVVCSFPPFVFRTLVPFLPDLSIGGKYHNTYYFLMNMQQLCIYINSSFNFFVYYLYGTKFRMTVKHLLCRKFIRKEKKSSNLK